MEFCAQKLFRVLFFYALHLHIVASLLWQQEAVQKWIVDMNAVESCASQQMRLTLCQCGALN